MTTLGFTNEQFLTMSIYKQWDDIENIHKYTRYVEYYMKITNIFYQEFGIVNTSLYGSIQGAQSLTILYTISNL
jgi:hypothetical protein